MCHKNQLFLVLEILVLATPFLTRAPAPAAGEAVNPPMTGGMTYSGNTWSLRASIIKVEEVSAAGSRGNAAWLTFWDGEKDDASYAWVLIDLEAYDYDAVDGEIRSGQEVLLYISGNYVNEEGIDYAACSAEPGSYCTVLNLVEGAYAKSPDSHDLPDSPGNRIIQGRPAGRNWWNGMLVWKILVQ